jgi:lipopolysaccharide transport system ATP-binding protein
LIFFTRDDIRCSPERKDSPTGKDASMARIQLEQVSLAVPARPAPLTLAWLLRGWCAPRVRHVLSGIDLVLNDGDRLAVVGPGGSGKTMLLQLLAGRVTATAGYCKVTGPVVDLVDPEAQLDPEASGEQHIDRLSKALRSLQARAMADCARLGALLDVPVGYYSPGMRWRLGFALAAARPADIVLADDVLARCDLAFRPLAERDLVQLVEWSRVAVLVERDLAFLADLCNKALWLQGGKIRQMGPARSVLASYYASTRSRDRAGRSPDWATDSRVFRADAS